MTNLNDDLAKLLKRIAEADVDTRHRFQPRLADLIHQFEAARQPVPHEATNLNEELLSDAIEAQFDNMPV